MSTYIGVRTHASEVHAAHKSRIAATNAARLAAAGLALMLSVGFSGGAHAAEGSPKQQSDPNDAAVEAADMVRVCHLAGGIYITVAPEAAERGHAEGHYDATGEACVGDSASDEQAEAESTETPGSDVTPGGDLTPGGDETPGSDETPGGDETGGPESAGSEESGDVEKPGETEASESGGSSPEESGGSEASGDIDEQEADEDSDRHEQIVLTPLPDQDARVEAPTQPDQAGGSGDDRGEVLGVEVEGSGLDKENAAPRGDTDQDDDGGPSGREVELADGPGFRDEILPAAAGTANRPAALVLPQTGAAANMALQAGAGLALLLAGLLTLAGRRRQDDC